MAIALQLDKVGVGYHGKAVVEDISLEIASGITCLLGPNGAGKTTLFKAMLGLLPCASGTISLFDRPLQNWSRRDLGRAIGYVPQAHAALFPFTTLDVVLMGRSPHLSAYASPSRADESIARNCLDRLGLLSLAARPYTELSGGERQMVLIARALAQQPQILFMDEPTASLDYGNQIRVLDQARALADDGMTIVFSTHNPEHALRIGDDVALIFAGGLYANAAPNLVLTPQTMREVYGVDVLIGTLPGASTPSIAPKPREMSNVP
ncbi:ABC transporter ATP-binding protein [Devosia sp. 2618]|uniref:ABC transporter ATP-binding protein n=1 Tax=Devosia sp. 2618 TaxID=3156454 RepID=UPI00339569D1